MQWGWNPDSFAAIATVLAAAAAMIAGVFAWLAYRAERDARQLASKAHDLTERAHSDRIEREQQREKEKERAQAEMVSAWTVVVEAEGGGKGVEMYVQNLSSAPVYSVCLGFVLPSAVDVYAGRVRLVPPNQKHPVLVAVKPRAVGEWRSWAVGARAQAAPYVELTFHDAAGRWWYRDGHGVLAETTETDAYRYGDKTSVDAASA